MNHQNFVDSWSKIEDRQEQLMFLKNYMLNLDGDALFEWVTGTSSIMFSTIQSQLNDENLTLEKRHEIERFLESLKNLIGTRKAA